MPRPIAADGLPAKFFGMIANLDENLGKLEAFLKDNGLRENTIVVFMTDNGATAGFNVHNAGMRGRKTMIYEGGHRVPCFVRWPAGNLRRRGRCRYPRADPGHPADDDRPRAGSKLPPKQALTVAALLRF